mgnify:CR=1 FL=1
MIAGGVNICPSVIEGWLHGYPDLLDVAVFGIPDDEWGESVYCIVQAKHGVDLDLDDLRAFAEANMAKYKVPRGWETRDELPRTDAGKLLKRVLRDEYWSDRAV